MHHYSRRTNSVKMIMSKTSCTTPRQTSTAACATRANIPNLNIHIYTIIFIYVSLYAISTYTHTYRLTHIHRFLRAYKHFPPFPHTLRSIQVRPSFYSVTIVTITTLCNVISGYFKEFSP